jgi:antitoxin component YwqK of YwqJK toxin-antitoxin module
MKSILALLFLTLFHHVATSQYLTEEKELKIDKDGWYYKKDQVFNGLVFSRYANNQIKSIYGVKNGVLYGEYKTYYLDSVYNSEQFQDSIVLNKLLAEKSLLDKSLSELTKDTLVSYNELTNFISEDAGGIKKWEKIQAKAIDGNLKEDSKTLWDRGQSLIKIHKDKKELQQKKLGNLEVLIKTIEREKSKQVHEGIIAEIENYQGSGSDPRRIAGPYTSFHKNGKKKVIKVYVPLTTTHFDQNENKLSEEKEGEKRFYINNLLSSVVTKNKTIIYEEGRKHRVEFKNTNENIQIDSTFYASGLISKVEEWQDNKKIKISLFNDKGKLIQFTMHYDVLNLESNFDHNSGKTIIYDDLAHNKSESFYYENGKKKLESTYFNDVKNGLEIAYYETGNLERETIYLKGKKHKDEILYWSHTTKEPKQILNEEYATEIEKSRRNADKKNIKTYIEGSLIGTNLFDSLGRKQQWNLMKNNKNQGTFELYYPSGSLRAKGNIDTLSMAKDHFLGDYFEYHEQGYYKGSVWVQDVLMHLNYRMDGKVIDKRSHPVYFGEKFAEDIIGNPFILGNIEVAEFDFPVYAENMFSLAFLNSTCAQLGEGWRLPTKDELQLIFDSLCVSSKSTFHDGKNYNLYLTSETFSKTYSLKEADEINERWRLYFSGGETEKTITFVSCLQFVKPTEQPIWVNNAFGTGESGITKSAIRAVRTIKQ